MNTESDRMIYEESSVNKDQGLVYLKLPKISQSFICAEQFQSFFYLFFLTRFGFNQKTVKPENSEKDQREYLESYASLRLSLALEIIKIYKDENFDTRSDNLEEYSVN